MSKTAIAFTVLAILAAALFSEGILVVDVRESGSGGHHVLVPFPLILARPLAALIPEKKSRIECPELAEHREAALQIVRELEAAPDTELVRVEQPVETVVIRKVNGLFEVRVTGGDERVLVRVPPKAVEEVIESFDGKAFRARDLALALRHLPRGEVVQVSSRTEKVQIKVW